MENNEFKNALVDALPLMYSYALRLAGNKDWARDIVQEVAVKALSKYYSYTVNENFKGLLYTIVYNTYLNDCKHVFSSPFVCDESLYDLNVCGESIDVYDIMHVISLLPNGLATPLIMLARGYRYCEIAEKMNLPIGTVKSRINKARNSLKVRLVS